MALWKPQRYNASKQGRVRVLFDLCHTINHLKQANLAILAPCFLNLLGLTKGYLRLRSIFERPVDLS